MKSPLILSLLLLPGAAGAGCGQLEHAPRYFVFGSNTKIASDTIIEWEAEVSLPVDMMVYRFIRTPTEKLNRAPIEIAESYGFEKISPLPSRFKEKGRDTVGCKGASPYEYLYYTPNWNTGRLSFLNKNEQPVYEPGAIPAQKDLPTDQEAYEMALQWMDRLGFDREQFTPDASGSGLEHSFASNRLGLMDTNTLERVWIRLNRKIRFRRQIDGYQIYFYGPAGMLEFYFVDGKRLAKATWSIRPVEPSKRMPLITKDEVVEAVRQGHAQGSPPFLDCDTVRITEVGVYYYESANLPTTDWCVPVLSLTCELEGGVHDGESLTLNMPALRVHHPWLKER